MKKTSITKQIILLGFIFSFSSISSAQSFTLSTWPTEDTISGSYSDCDAVVTFNVENLTDSSCLLKQVEMIYKYGNFYTGTIPTLWYSASSLANSSTVSEANDWHIISIGSPLTILGYDFYPLFQNLNFTIPPHTQYRFAVESTKGMRYNTYSWGLPSLYTTFTSNGIRLRVLDASSSPTANDTVGCGGCMPFITPAETSFAGRITLEPLNTTPVKLLAFTATYNNKDANIINWQTSQELNSKNFTIQKAYTLPLFTNVATLPAAANSSTIKSYAYTDNDIEYKPTYYRLLQTDKDGKTAYSKTVLVTPYKNSFAISKIYPNPAKESVMVEYNSKNITPCTFIITDMLSRQVQKLNLQPVKGFNKQLINTSRLAKGKYVITLENENEKVHGSFVKE